MPYRTILCCLIANIGILVLAVLPAQADLRPVEQFFGNISLSVDAEGNNDPLGGVIRVEKPVDATVRAAFLMANSHGVFGNRVIADGDVTLAGTPISWDRTEFNDISSRPAFFHNVFADVTSIVKPVIDAAPAGITGFLVTETGTAEINGTILVVVFDDPNETTDNSVILLFGGQATGGETFLINLAEPIGPVYHRADMGLGIGHGYQGTTGTPQVNRIIVNSTRLTSSAGGEDDGESIDGALITVGGVGDSNANPPDPYAPSAGFGTDDELYDLGSFLALGDAEIEVFSNNPTDDDNIFFAYFFTSFPSAVLPDILPPVSGDLVGILDPLLPTIILTHGLQDDDDKGEYDKLWTGNGPKQATTLIGNRLGVNADKVNIVQYIWEEAWQPDACGGLPEVEGYLAAQRSVISAGARLARILADGLGSDYKEGVHFIGHSLGTAVNAQAARGLLAVSPLIEHVQVTALDRPHHIRGRVGRGICHLTAEQEGIYGYDANYFASILPSRPGLHLRLDNYFSFTDAGVGDVANGSFVYNHPRLVEPNQVGGGYFPEENGLSGIDNNHSGVQQWYRWTIDPNAEAFMAENFPDDFNCIGSEWQEPPRIANFDPSLNPCTAGWNWALLRFAPDESFVLFPKKPKGATAEITYKEITWLSAPRLFGCTIRSEDPITIICTEHSSPFAVLEVDIPEDTAFISFEYAFTKIGDGDYAAVLLDGNPIWVLSGDDVMRQGEFINSGPIPVGVLTGNRTITIALYGVGEPNAEFQVRNFSASAVSVLERIEIDIRPEETPNSINPRSKGLITVAILTTDTFDASFVDLLSLEFGPSRAVEIHGAGHTEDVDGDGDLDLLLHFDVRDTGISCGDALAVLRGETFDGQGFEGSDSITTVGCK